MSTYSNEIAKRIFRAMSNVADETGIGTVKIEDLFVLDAAERLRRRPDVAFVSIERWPLDRELPAEGDWSVVPDLCVEVTGPHDLFNDVSRKLQEYFRHGVNEVWIVSPAERQVHVYNSINNRRILSEEDVLSGGELLPGFDISLTDLFRRQPGSAQ